MSILLPIVLLIIKAKGSFFSPTDCGAHSIEQVAISQFRFTLHGLDETVSQGASTFHAAKGLINQPIFKGQSLKSEKEQFYSNSQKSLEDGKGMHYSLLLTDVSAAFPSSSQAEMQTASPPLVPL